MPLSAEALRDWHRLFGLILGDSLTGTPYEVEVEPDLSLQQQYLDVTIVRRRRGRLTLRLPDGLHRDLADHNLVTFKSHHEALGPWALYELVGHYVAYRKLTSASTSALLPEGDFRLYAVSARYPHNLAGQLPLIERQAGVYDCSWGPLRIRVIVAGQLPQEPHNAALHLFSASSELLQFGRSSYQQRSERTSNLLNLLLTGYGGEGGLMAYTFEDFVRDYAKKHFKDLTPQERREALALLPPEERREFIQMIPPEERLADLPPKERLAGLSPEERLADLSPEEARRLLERIAAGPQPAPPRKRRRKT